MPTKTFYFDVETTGLDPKKNAIIQLAYIVDIDGKCIEDGEFLIAPHPNDVIEPTALEVNGRNADEISKFTPPGDTLKKIIKFLNKYIDQYDRTDKFYPAGYNVKFDVDFLKAFFEKCGHKYFGSYFNYKFIDPLTVFYWHDWIGSIKLPNYKLETVAEKYGIELDAHDAVNDIKATRELILRFKNTTVIPGLEGAFE